jgi:poly-beta-hydroxyalkanoate depolymerase
MKEILVYSYQEWDGGDRHNHKAYFSNKADADLLVNENKYNRYDERLIVVFDSLEEFYEHDVKKLKERALAKLTMQERKALGY